MNSYRCCRCVVCHAKFKYFKTPHYEQPPQQSQSNENQENEEGTTTSTSLNNNNNEDSHSKRLIVANEEKRSIWKGFSAFFHLSPFLVYFNDNNDGGSSSDLDIPDADPSPSQCQRPGSMEIIVPFCDSCKPIAVRLSQLHEQLELIQTEISTTIAHVSYTILEDTSNDKSLNRSKRNNQIRKDVDQDVPIIAPDGVRIKSEKKDYDEEAEDDNVNANINLNEENNQDHQEEKDEQEKEAEEEDEEEEDAELSFVVENIRNNIRSQYSPVINLVKFSLPRPKKAKPKKKKPPQEVQVKQEPKSKPKPKPKKKKQQVELPPPPPPPPEPKKPKQRKKRKGMSEKRMIAKRRAEKIKHKERYQARKLKMQQEAAERAARKARGEVESEDENEGSPPNSPGNNDNEYDDDNSNSNSNSCAINNGPSKNSQKVEGGDDFDEFFAADETGQVKVEEKPGAKRRAARLAKAAKKPKYDLTITLSDPEDDSEIESEEDPDFQDPEKEKEERKAKRYPVKVVQYVDRTEEDEEEEDDGVYPKFKKGKKASSTLSIPVALRQQVLDLTEVTPGQFLYGKSAFELLEHGEYSCKVPECSFWAEKMDQVFYHMNNMHNEDRFPCKICQHSYADEKKLAKHVCTPKKEKRRKNITEKLPDGTFLYNGNWSFSEEPDGYYKCTTCQALKSTMIAMGVHIREHHAEPDRFKCEHCDSSFGNKKSWQIHTSLHTATRDFLCDECPKTFKSASHLANHKAVHSEIRFACNICPKQFLFSASLSRHRRETGHLAPAVLAMTGLAPESSSSPSTSTAPSTATTTAEDSNSTNEETAAAAAARAAKIVFCPRCNRPQETVQAFNVHLKFCGNDKKLLCEICSKPFNVKSYLLAHIERCHRSETQEVRVPVPRRKRSDYDDRVYPRVRRNPPANQKAQNSQQNPVEPSYQAQQQQQMLLQQQQQQQQQHHPQHLQQQQQEPIALIHQPNQQQQPQSSMETHDFFINTMLFNSLPHPPMFGNNP